MVSEFRRPVSQLFKVALPVVLVVVRHVLSVTAYYRRGRETKPVVFTWLLGGTPIRRVAEARVLNK